MRMEAKYVRRRAIAKSCAEIVAMLGLITLYAPLILYTITKYWN